MDQHISPVLYEFDVHLAVLPRCYRMAFWVICAVVVLCPHRALAQLSQNSGINANDSWAAFDLATNTQITSGNIAPPTIAQTHHVEIGYDTSGSIVVNIWPTGGSALASDSGQVSVIRLSGGNVTVFDQNGAPIPYVLPVSNVPAFNPLSLLGSNPGSSILSQLVVSNISTQATKTNAQISYSGSDALLSGTYSSGGSSGTVGWNYVQSGSLWIATHASLSVSRPNYNATRTLQFSNVNWNANATNDAARASKGSTAVSPPAATTATPAALTASSSSNCVPFETNQGGAQNVVFQHGFFSSGCTWWRMEPWLNQHFRFGIELAPSLNSLDNLTNQGTALINDINSAGGTGYILIGHSQGGLISRYAAQYFQQNKPGTTMGVLTLDTPHQGAPLAALAQGTIQNVLLGDMLNIFGDVGCSSPFDNILCYLVALQYSGVSEQLINIGALTDLVPGSAFLTNLNSQAENFRKAAVVGNTPRRWIEVRVADEFIFKGCNPEDGCGERNVVFIYGIIYDIVQISWDIAEFDCILTDDPYACAVADFLLPIWVDMDIADLDYNVLAAGGSPEDGIVPSSSQNYPSGSAVQYPISNADSHMGATRSDRARNALEQALSSPQFNVPTQASCSFSASPPSFSTSSSATTSSFSLNTGAGCQWSAVSQAPWIGITSGTSGTSSGSVSFSVAANTVTVPRTGTVTIGNDSSGAAFTVQQSALCTYALSASTVAIPPGGGSATINVFSPSGCPWTAVPNAGWLTITAGASGTGSGSFTLAGGTNSGSTNLVGTITVMQQTLTVILGNPAGTPGMGSVTINGGARSKFVCNTSCDPSCRLRSCASQIYEYGSVTVTVAGDSFTAEYSGSVTGNQIATNLAKIGRAHV